MADDEDHIRQFMPVLRRIIILVAVLTAIPVAMWTITAFVRTYVGQPKTPTFQRIADATPPSGTPDRPTTTDNLPTGSIQAPPPPVADAKAVAPGGTGDTQALDPSKAPTPIGGPTNAAAPPIPTSPPVAGGAPTGPTSPSATPPSASPPPPTPVIADTAAPNPPAYAAPSDPADSGGVRVAAQQPAPANWPTPPPAAATDALPPGDPIAGRVPLPRARPKTFLVAQNIPLPTPRPGTAGEGAPQAASTPLDWLHHIFQPSGAAAQPPADDNNGYVDTPH